MKKFCLPVICKILTAGLIISSCTQPDDVFHLENIKLGEGSDENTAAIPGIAADAKQRFVWSPLIPVRQLKDTEENTFIESFEVKPRRIVCAEPSPDALSTFSASIGAALRAEIYEKGGVGGEVSQSLTETARVLGERTPTIQLLRDSFYRACEAYGNGLVDNFGYALILNKIDNVMVQLLAIDALGRGQLTATDVGKISASAEAEEAAQQASGVLQEAERTNSESSSNLANLRAQRQTLARQISSMKAEEAQAKEIASAAGRAEEQIPAVRETLTNVKVSIATKEAKKLANDQIAADIDKPQDAREIAQSQSQNLAGELAGLTAQRQTAEENLRELETRAKRGQSANQEVLKLAATIAVLETQKNTIDTDVAQAENTVSSAKQALDAARSAFSSAQATSEGKRAVLGTIEPELSNEAMLQIGRIARESHSGDYGLSTIAGACAIWFAQHPQISASLIDNKFALADKSSPAIAQYCAYALNSIVAAQKPKD